MSRDKERAEGVGGMTFEIWSKNCTLHSVREIQTDNLEDNNFSGEKRKGKKKRVCFLVDTKMESNLETIFKIKVIVYK